MVLKEQFQPNTRDDEIIKLCYEHRYLTTDLLAALLVRPATDGRKYGFTLSALRARCHKLRTNGFLTWHHLTDQPIGRWHGTKHPAVYSIGSKAVPILASRYDRDPKQLQLTIKRNAVGSFFLRHYLGIAKFRICLLLACQQSDGAVVLNDWIQDDRVKDSVRVMVQENGQIVPAPEDYGGDEYEIIPVVPDAVFSLFQPSERRIAHFFLEFDRGTMPLTDIRRKAHGFWCYRQAKLHQRKYTYAKSAEHAPRLDVFTGRWNRLNRQGQEFIREKAMRDFQVLFVAKPTQQDVTASLSAAPTARQRQQNMAATVREIIPGRPAKNSRFFFATDDLDYQLEQPASILGRIWQSSGSADPALYSLLD